VGKDLLETKRFPEFYRFQFPRHSAYECGNFGRDKEDSFTPQEIFLLLIPLSGRAIMRPDV
jgi:hypothetical protein